jgi:hypothetical protein
LSLGFENFAVSKEKSHFFQKKAKKSKKINSVENEKKNSLGESMFKKSAKSEMVTGRLIDSYKKTL